MPAARKHSTASGAHTLMIHNAILHSNLLSQAASRQATACQDAAIPATQDSALRTLQKAHAHKYKAHYGATRKIAA